ncbi:Ig-like domain-containing protein [Metabacillus fastidiosus]|uniref:Ig-like domain-containing protein n=1 Tax=Metabacillus fastidiosus TaxID=1458 RepID=UPI002E2197CD|nr:Ig-like domain-containing protein [Metabacillus fastidiosus]
MKRALMFSILLILFIFSPTLVSANEPTFVKDNVPLDKVWTITFNRAVDSSTVNDKNIYLTDRYGSQINTILIKQDIYNMNQVIVSNSSKYKYSDEYFLHITPNVKDMNGKSLNKHTVLKFITIDNPNFSDLSNIHTAAELTNYLNTNYSELDTAVGKWEMKFTYSGSPTTKLRFVTSWRGGSPYTLHYDNDQLEILEYGRTITKEEATATKKQLRDFQQEVARVAMNVFPNVAIDGGFYEGGFKYPHLQIGYWSVPFLSWKNYYDDAYDTNNTYRKFHWNPKNDDYNFVTDQPIGKVYVINPTTRKYIAYEDADKIIKIKKGEKVEFAFDIEVNPELSYSEIGLRYYYSDYSGGKIIKVDKFGNIIGNKVGEQDISVSYYWDPYVSHYFKIVVEE